MEALEMEVLVLLLPMMVTGRKTQLLQAQPKPAAPALGAAAGVLATDSGHFTHQFIVS